MIDRSSRVVLTLCCWALLAVACNQQTAAPDQRAADEAAIRDADIAWSKLAENKDLDGHVGLFLEDAQILAPNEAIVTGREAIREVLEGYYATPGFAVKWQPTKVEASRSGDLGYSLGTYQISMNDSNGMPVMDRGKYATVWKKQADGTWKVAVDMFNSDLPVASE